MRVVHRWLARFHRPVGTIATLITSVLMIWLFLKFVEASNIREAITRLRVDQMIPVFIFVAGLFTARSVRFAFLIGNIKHAPYGAATGATVQAYALNSLIPFRPGEFWRVEKLRRLRRKGFVDAVSLSIFDRSFDVLFCLLLMLPMIMVNSSMLFSMHDIEWGLFIRNTVLVLSVTAIIGAVLVKQRSRILALGSNYWQTLVSMRSLLSPMLLTSIVIWVFEYAVCESVARTLGLLIPVVTMCFVIGFSNLFGALIPSPGGVGAFEGSVIWLLTALNGQGLGDATTYSIIVHTVLIIPVTVVGFTWMTIDLVMRRVGVTKTSIIAQQSFIEDELE